MNSSSHSIESSPLAAIHAPVAGVIAPVSERDDTNSRNLLLLVQLRWLAVMGQLATIIVAEWQLGLDLPQRPMLWLLVALALLNVASYAWLRYRADISQRALSLSLMLDVLALTGQLYFSGGVTNPFVHLYLLQITLGAVLLKARLTWSIVSLAAACLLLLTQFNVPLRVVDRPAEYLTRLSTIGLLVCYALNAALIVTFISRINRNLRRRDKHLAELRQQAAEEEQIVRMGLLASGAAHELGTPLASVAVILGDWRRMPTVADQPELIADIDDMQAAIQRCKAIVTGILLSSGEARGEATTVTTVGAFLQETINDWRAARPHANLHLQGDLSMELAIASDSTIKQMICNLLDNAADASPHWLQLRVSGDMERLSLQVSDAGPGFAPEILQHFGKPYQSTKGRSGGGLGLFLVVNVVRKLGGSVTARNQSTGGAMVTVVLPLAPLRIGTPGSGVING